MRRAEAAQWAHVIATARRERRVIDPITDEVEFDMQSAYYVQELVDARRIEAGEQPIGWKLGYTSQAMRREMGVDSPNIGTLTDAMLLNDGADVGGDLVQPRVEPEIGLRLRHDLSGPVTEEEALGAVGEVTACLEVVDSVWRDYRFRIEDNTADGSSAARVVVGGALALERLGTLSVVLTRNGTRVAAGTADAAMGGPFRALAWLAAELAGRGDHLPRGSFVITGGLTPTAALQPGDVVEAAFDELVVRVCRSSSEAGSGVAQNV